MLSADSVRAQILALVSGQLSLDDFEDWIVQASWNVQHVDPLRRLVSAIELRLAEHSSGHLDQPDLFAELHALLWHEPLQPIPSLFLSIGGPHTATESRSEGGAVIRLTASLSL